MTFKKRNSNTHTVEETVHMWSAGTLANLTREARTAISVLGFHNFGIGLDETKTAEVQFTLVHFDDPSHTYSGTCVVDGSGHLATSK